MARRAYVRATIACACNAADGHDPSRTSPMPRRYCSTSSWSTSLSAPGAATASSAPRYWRWRAGTATVAPAAGMAHSGRAADAGGVAVAGFGVEGFGVVVAGGGAVVVVGTTGGRPGSKVVVERCGGGAVVGVVGIGDCPGLLAVAAVTEPRLAPPERARGALPRGWDAK